MGAKPENGRGLLVIRDVKIDGVSSSVGDKSRDHAMTERLDVAAKKRHHVGIGLYPCDVPCAKRSIDIGLFTVMCTDVQDLVDRNETFRHELFEVQQQFASRRRYSG
jgi:hypothetical protein